MGEVHPDPALRNRDQLSKIEIIYFFFRTARCPAYAKGIYDNILTMKNHIGWGVKNRFKIPTKNIRPPAAIGIPDFSLPEINDAIIPPEKAPPKRLIRTIIHIQIGRREKYKALNSGSFIEHVDGAG